MVGLLCFCKGIFSFCFSQENMQDFCYYAQRWEELLQSKFLFVKGTIYNLVIDLFMCLHRLSLDATGHVWEANVFMALFLISQAVFPTAFCFYGVQTKTPASFLKNCLSFVSWKSEQHKFATLHCSFARMVRRTFQLCAYLTSCERRSPVLHSKTSMYCIGKPKRVNMDYLPSIGKHSVW